MTVQLQDASGSPVNATSNVTVSLSSSSSGGAFSNGTSTITSVTIPSGSSNASFYYTDSKAGTPTITAAATDLTSATQTVTINAAALDHITLSPASAIITAGDSQSYTAEAYDAYGNDLGDVTASTTFSLLDPISGSCTGASCAPTTAGDYSVAGSLGGKIASASLTVTSAVGRSLRHQHDQ